MFGGMRILAPLLLVAGSAFGIEKPDYEVLEKEKQLELRKYADIPVASAPMGGMGERNDSFRKLFRYIQGNNAAKQKIEMTSPVFMEPGAGEEAAPQAGRMSFMIPATVAKKGAPEPGGQEVNLDKIPGGKFAVIRFSGHRSEAKRTAAVEALKAWVARKGWTSSGEPFFAYYDPPWTPEFMRRNEVWLRLEP